MGKSKRIRAERAHAIAANPEKYVKSENTKKTTVITIVIVAVIAALLLGTIALAITQSTGFFLRLQSAYSTENFSISGTMMTYLYQMQFNNTYNLYYQYLGSSVQNYVSSIQTQSKNSVKTQAEQILMLCEAARAANVSLDEEDYAEIEETIKNIEDSTKKLGVSISAYFGNLGVTADDIRSMLELSTLASKYDEIKLEEFKDSVKNDEAAILQYISDHMSKFYKADYLTYTADTKELADKLATLKTSDEFLSELIKMTVEDKFTSEFKSAASKLDAAKKPVKALAEAIKAVLVEELKYSLLEIKIEGLEFKDDSTRKERIKAIFEKLYGDKTFAAGEDDKETEASAVTVSDELYTVITTAGEAISKTASSTVKSAKKYEQTYALPDVADEEEKEDEDTSEDSEEDEEDKPTKTELWVFDNERKEGDSTVITNEAEKETDKDTYTVVVMVKPNYLDTEMTKDVGHILLKVETETASSSATDEEKKEIEEKNEQAFADKKTAAEEILALVAGKTKDEFEAIGKEKNEDSNIFYEGVHTGDMVEEFEEWLFDEARKVGDTGLVRTTYGWHVMYFVGDGGEAWKNDAISAYASDAWSDWYEALTYTVNANDRTIDNACS